RPDSPPIQEEMPKHRRFSMLRFRNASDSQLSARAKKQAYAHADEAAPPVPRGIKDPPSRPPSQSRAVSANAGSTAPPEIITTAPTVEFHAAPRKKQSSMFARLRRSGEELRTEQAPSIQPLSRKDRRKSLIPSAYSSGRGSISMDEPPPPRPKSSNAHPGHGRSNQDPPPQPPLPMTASRLSESSRSEESAAGRFQTNTPTSISNSSSTNNFFRLRRKPKPSEPLFPLAHLQRQRSNDQGTSPNQSLPPSTPTPVASASNGSNGATSTTPPGASPGRGLLARTNASPATALFRPLSPHSGTSSPTRSHMNLRGRSSTMSSLGRDSLDDRLGLPQSRASTSTTGRKSFGDLLGISRLRGPDSMRQGPGTPATPGSNTSKDNSLQIQRESVVLPDKREDENPGRYLERLEDIASRSMIAAAVAKSADAFHLAVLRSFMRKFGFFGDPMDMAIRKLLMSAELPKETQHIDRFLQAFANRYHECNPGIYTNPEQAYFIAFSLLILHTDVFNKNNKHKMQKHDYIKNTKGEGIANEILEGFYDNITYTPFIHVEDEVDMGGGDRPSSNKNPKRKPVLPIPTAPEAALKKAAKEPLDPYTLILDNRLDILRPNLKEVMYLDDHFNYTGTVSSLNLKELQNTFFRTGILQIVSARSRPDAFMSEKTATNPDEAQPGVVDIKVTKVGLLWRKDAKKKKTRSPWQEWGAILTGAQLYFFRNTTWIKHLMHQYDSHIKQGHDGIPIVFKPPLESFKPDALMSTDGAVALLDTSYKKHKHAFVYVRHGGLEEVLLADDDEEMNDWLAKLNYAAAFRTNGVRMRGVTAGTYDGQGRRSTKKDTEAVQTPSGEVLIARSRLDQQMTNDILFARRELMLAKVAEANQKLQEEEKKLEEELRNARHLQLLAPIQPKTREAMLLAAARMAAQLKWTRVAIWKLKCHRDIMLLDLEEERQILGLPPGPISEILNPNKGALQREMSKTSKASSGTIIQSPSIQVSTPAQRSQSVDVADPVASAESPINEVFTTPPSTIASPLMPRHQSSGELRSLNLVPSRRGSVSSAISSSRPALPVTPPRNPTSFSSGTDHGGDGHPEEDANERDLLEKTGLLSKEITMSPEYVDKTRSNEPDQAADPNHQHQQQPHSNSLDNNNKDKMDKNKIRRSLQRTLREGAGHLSHGRSRRGREGPGSNGSMDDNNEAAEMLTRGAGPFVVHGKKASVIHFGSELQSLTSDERLRARKSSVMDDATTTANGGILGAAGTANERRSSAASASTATARSFRELHRKYSSAAKYNNTSAANLALSLVVPGGGDEDSDAAVSFSDGRRTPLPIEHVEEVVEEEDEEDEYVRARSDEEDLSDGEGNAKTDEELDSL
ncbi:hypothetical protein BD289DRAFT_346033, partial [Coniella lustricola]